MVSKTIALRTELQRLLKTLTGNVHYEEASDKTYYPYIVYEFSDITQADGRTTMQLEVNCYDNGKSTAAVDSLADNVQSALHKYFAINALVEFTIYAGARQIIREEDKKIKRRRLLFTINLHELRGE